MAGLENKIRVAIFDEFLDSFARLPRAQQKKVSRFMRKFRSDPTSHSINYEKIHTFADPNMRTVRIDDAYRAIVLQPPTGNVYVLLWVDHHDDAMDWAQNKKVVIHPETGSLQVLAADMTVPEPVEEPKKKSPSKPKLPPLFHEWRDEDLFSLGLPQELLESVRELKEQEQIDSLKDLLPPEAYEALWFLADGETLQEVRKAMGLEAEKEVDPEDFEAALDNDLTKRRFALITDDQELEAMLDAPLEKWRVFLHPSQSKLVTANFNGPARVLGGAGTGKTVVAMHRARHLATSVFNGENERILFTTFTRNLAADIRENLRKLCPPQVARRIEVVHLDKWVSDFLQKHGYNYRIAYWPNEPLRELWEKAMHLAPSGFTSEFFREEWDYVVQPEGCESFDDYRSVRRTGRGVRLSRKQRREVWPVFEEYRNLLEEKGLRESIDAMRDAIVLLESGTGQSSYRAIVVDEAQDMSTIAFTLLRSLILIEQPNDLFIVGDSHQRIYRHKVVLKHAGVNIVGRSRKLYINYRTTEEIRRYAVALLEGCSIDDLDGGSDNNRRYKSLVFGQPPTIRSFPTFAAELDAIAEFVKLSDPSHTCLVLRTRSLLDQYEAALQERGLESYRIRRSEAEDRSAPGLRMATMHRVKGLEFDRLVIAAVNEGVVPLETEDLRSDDGAVREETELRERALLYVATTRARREVLITSSGQPSPWMKGIV